MTALELLAPARTADIGIEAIRHGADAVYIGGPGFGARSAAGNSVADIARLVAFAHPFRVRVYVTLNTLLLDDELPEVQSLIWQLYDVGVSALIIQDPKILSLRLPPIPLHASTQMDNRTAARVAELHDCGFEQVVLARELTIEQMAEIHRACPDIRLETFIHGALCVGLSGRCYASERLFNRSANRGECAQFCRLAFNLEDADGNVLVRDRHLLSLRDMNRSAHLEQLIDAGITSFKIEGRLKDMSYVKNITAHYRLLLNTIIARRNNELCRSSLGREDFTFTPNPERSFNRRFTSYLSTSDIFSPFTPKAIGEPVGSVLAVHSDHIVTDFPAVAGDGLCFFNTDSHLEGFRVNRVESSSQSQGSNHNRIKQFPNAQDIQVNNPQPSNAPDARYTRIYPRPMPSHLSVGTPLFRNQDQEFDRQLAARTASRVIDIDITISDSPSEAFTLTATANGYHPASITKPFPHQPARTDQHDNIRRQLSRLGDTPFSACSIDIHFSDHWFIPSSLLADWRRELVSLLQPVPLPVRPYSPSPLRPSLPTDAPDLLMICHHCRRRELDICPFHKRPTTLQNILHSPHAQHTHPLLSDSQAPNSQHSTSAPSHAKTSLSQRPTQLHPAHDTNSSSARYKFSQRTIQIFSAHDTNFYDTLYLSLPDGRRFRLEFDCKQCQMLLFNE